MILRWLVYAWDWIDWKLIGTKRNRDFPPTKP